MLEKEVEENKVLSLLDIATSHVTQHTSGHIKSDWSVELNETDEKIHIFPKHFSDNEIFDIMDFAKKYELEAFNKGIKFGKRKTIKIYQEKLDEATARMKYMAQENERLANALEQIYHNVNKEI